MIKYLFLRFKIYKIKFVGFVRNKAGYLIPFNPFSEAKRILFISEPDPICQAQLFPFFFFNKALSNQPLSIRELPLKRFKANQHPFHVPVDVICLQTWFDYTTDEMENLLLSIKHNWPNAKLVYFDWFATTDLRYAEVLDPYIDVYLKKPSLKILMNIIVLL
jgi:hypothetical protein